MVEAGQPFALGRKNDLPYMGQGWGRSLIIGFPTSEEVCHTVCEESHAA